MVLNDKDSSKMKAVVDCIVYDEDNKDMLDNHLLKYIKDNNYSYVSSFVNGVSVFSPIQEENRALDCKNIQTMLEEGYISGFKFDTNIMPDLLKNDVVEFIIENYKFFPEVYLIKSWSLLPRTNSPMFIDFSTPFFLEEQLNAKHLIIIDSSCEAFKENVELAVLKGIRDSIYEWMINCPVDGVKDKIVKAKIGAALREELDKRRIDWKQFPADAERGVYHDEAIDDVNKMFEGESSTFHRVDDETNRMKDVKLFAEDKVEGITFNKACKLYNKDISWRDYYRGTLSGYETDLFYINKEPFMKLKDVSGGKREYYKHYGMPSLQFHLTPYEFLVDKDKKCKKIVFEYLKYNEGIDPVIVDYISDFYGVKLNDKEFDLKPAPIYIEDYEEKNGKQLKKEDTQRYKWEQSHKELHKKYMKAAEEFFTAE